MMGIGNELRDKIKKRTGLSESNLKCPREKSDMTPCVARDGDSAMFDDLTCVGCSISVEELFNVEKTAVAKVVLGNARW